jgi:hypothetical protein
VLAVSVHSAGIMDRDGVKLLLADPSPPGSRGCSMSGWTPATMGAAKARTGSNRRSAGARRSSSIAPATRRSGSSRTCPTTRSTGRNTCPRPAFGCCLGAGWWSGRSRGSPTPAGSARTTSGCAAPARHSSLSV